MFPGKASERNPVQAPCVSGSWGPRHTDLVPQTSSVGQSARTRSHTQQGGGAGASSNPTGRPAGAWPGPCVWPSVHHAARMQPRAWRSLLQGPRKRREKSPGRLTQRDGRPGNAGGAEPILPPGRAPEHLSPKSGPRKCLSLRVVKTQGEALRSGCGRDPHKGASSPSASPQVTTEDRGHGRA